MIRTAIGIGVLAILCGVGVILYRHMQTQGDLTQLTPPSLVPTPPKTVPQPNPSPEPAPANPAPVPAPIPVVNPEDRPAQSQPVAPVQPAPAKQPAAEQTGSGLVTYKVQSGDSLWEISCRFYHSPNHIKQIADANNLSANAMLRIGQMLVIPEIRENKSTPADADHEASAVPPRTENNPKHEDAEPMPPTLSRTVPAK